MEKVTFYPCKKKGEVRVKYRIRDGRSGQVYYTTDILCSEKDLEKLNPDGSRKDRVKLFNVDLAESLKKEYEVMMAAYFAHLLARTIVLTVRYRRDVISRHFPA